MINGRQCRTGDHVGRAWPDRRCTRKGLYTIFHFGEATGHMHCGLFITDKNIREVWILLQSLTDACHIAMTKDSQHAGKELDLLSVTPHVLVLQEFDDGLCRGQS